MSGPLGSLGPQAAKSRRRIAEKNISLCLHELGEKDRQSILRDHFRLLVFSFLSEGILAFSSEKRLFQEAVIEGEEHLEAISGRPAILFGMHFCAMSWLTLVSRGLKIVAIYRKPKIAAFDKLFRRTRMRYGVVLVTSREGLRPVLAQMRKGRSYLCLPDHDLGPRQSIFVPFFRIPTATTPVLSRLGQMTGAMVLPIETMIASTPPYFRIRVHPPLEDFPSGDQAADTARMNAFIEERVREAPAQYYWVHKRFKTRPPGEDKIY